MYFPKADFNWAGLWADLLKGAGTGLIEYDDSRAAQAALAGLQVFDAAQERRRRQDRHERGRDTFQDMFFDLWSKMTPEERAASLRLRPEEWEAYKTKWAEAGPSREPWPGSVHPSNRGRASPAALPPITAQPPQRGRPISVNPIEGWDLQSILPLGSNGALNWPTYRR